MREIRSRRAGIGPAEARDRPLYARVLGLQFLRPSSLMCFLFFEGTIALAVLLALAELVTWWAVLVLPVSVAMMVKINDAISGATTRSGAASPRRSARSRPEPTEYEPFLPDPAAPARSVDQPTLLVRLRDATPRRGEPEPDRAEPDRPVLNRAEPDSTEQWLSSPEQRARQSANHRYE